MTRTTRRRRVLPTTAELKAWRVFIETSEALRSELGTRLQAESALSSGDYSVLLALSETDGHRLRSSLLADHVGWERSRLSHHLGRMERRGLIRREDCSTDNRGSEVVLTDEGAAMFRAATVPHLTAVRELFVDALTPEQIAAVGEIAAALQAHLNRSS
ncbi:MarR family transcriptional regulator [Kibdelosporangium philippinense]|uniref:MarR family transcriptional regulator n=1 Tax=Kibdelosporangium philippinense TaxID=211113 RepID=A0ABS8Z6G7_9PSEU|nr:MarR family transcriptional regulator [Kibdelosporangium philippinense]MCE7002380.1 MarR family transcriptional regulator [Kibdelosporangium philippinense]